MNAPGRVCPLRYRYGPGAIAGAEVRPAQTLYVIGGLYGNVLRVAPPLSLTAAEADVAADAIDAALAEVAAGG